MAQVEKVRELLALPTISEGYDLVIKGLFTQLAAQYADEEDSNLFLQVQLRVFDKIKALVFEHLTDVYTQYFSDEELGELATFYSSTIAKKLQMLSPVIQASLATHLTSQAAVLEKMMSDAFDELEDAAILKRMCEVAKGRLDSPETLRLMYLENEDVPAQLRDVIRLYCYEKITKEEVEERLTALVS